MRFQFLLTLLLAAAPAHAQMLYGSIVGNVADPSQAPVPAAEVRIQQRETGQTRSAKTNDSGMFTFTTVTSGTYDVTIVKQGFQTYTAEAVKVAVDQTARVNAELRVGSVSDSVQVSAEAAALQTDSAETRAEITAHTLSNLPIPVNRNYESAFVAVPGFSPPDNQNSVPANPSRGLTFSVNGATRQSNNIRIDGASSNNVWLAEVAGYVPALEAIETVSVVTNSFDMSQGLAGGAAINVHIKSGGNELHGSAFGYNMNNALTTSSYFAPAGQRKAKYINNDFGGTLGGPIRKNKLFYFLSYDGNAIRQNAGKFVTVPTAAMRAGDESASTNPIYDPATGSADGTNRTPFAANQIPTSRFAPAAVKLMGIVPLPNVAGLTTNNYYATGPYRINRNTSDAKVDWHVNDKLTLTPRLGWTKYDITNPLAFGDNGPGVGSGRGGWGYGDVFSTTMSGTYMAKPNLVIDGYYTVTVIGTSNDVPRMNENLGRDFLGIPGTNGPTMAYGGWPQISVSSFTDIGNAGGSSGPIYYDDRQYQYAANASWVKSAHTLRFGYEWSHQNINHFDPSTAPGHLQFNGGATTLNKSGAPGANQWNNFSTFLLGQVSSAEADIYPFDNSRAFISMPTYRLYAQDQWQASRKLTVSAGLGWNYFPMASRTSRGLERLDYNTLQIHICGVAGYPHDCGYDISKRLFSPSLGLAFRPSGTWVVRTGFALNYDPETYAYNRDLLTNYPESLSLTMAAPSSWVPATTFAQGITPIAVPDISSGVVQKPKGFAASSLPQHPRRDYILSWNFTVQKQLAAGFVAQAGYVATRGVDIPQQLNLNVAQVGGGSATQPFVQKFGDTATIRILTPINHTHYDSLQTSLSRRFSNGVMVSANYTFSKNTGICCDDLSDGAPAIQLPQYMNLNRSLSPTDRTHNFNLSTVFEFPFGKGKRFVNKNAALSAMLGGWQANALFVRYSGQPFSVGASSTSLNASGNTQRADQVKPEVEILGGHGPGQSYFDPLAFANVTQARFGTAGFNTLRGPGTANLDFSIFRNFRIAERVKLQFRGEAFNLTNSPHFGTPGSSVANLSLNPDGSVKSLGSYTIISSTTGVGREGIDQRALRFGIRVSF
jgi:hypothetical protein